jgi:hypothetical protein
MSGRPARSTSRTWLSARSTRVSTYVAWATVRSIERDTDVASPRWSAAAIAGASWILFFAIAAYTSRTADSGPLDPRHRGCWLALLAALAGLSASVPTSLR